MQNLIKWITCVLVLGIMVVPVQAQWYKQLGAAVEHSIFPRLHQGSVERASLPGKALDRAVHQATLKTLSSQAPPAQRAVFVLKERHWILRFGSIEGTAFAIEETYQGKKYVWGVTATHYLFQKPAVQLPPNYRVIRVPFVVQGSPSRNDIALFPISPKFAKQLVPLKLAAQDAQLNEELSSVGYWKHKIHVDPVRTVQEIVPSRIVTSLDIDPKTVREGTCGSPVLNKNGEVVGVHAGNSPRQQIGYVLPVSHIRQALQAYHEGSSTQTLLFNGVDLGPIAVNEYLTAVYVYQGEVLKSKKSLALRQKQVDYAHLETLIEPDESVTRVVFSIERNPLSSEQKDQLYHTFLLSYDLQTGQVFRSEQGSSALPGD